MQSENERPVVSTLTSANNASAYCVGGVAAVIVGLLILGIPCSLLAIFLGREGYKRGAQTFGKVVVGLGAAELILTTLMFVAIVAGG
jgi:hypothetical protein